MADIDIVIALAASRYSYLKRWPTYLWLAGICKNGICENGICENGICETGICENGICKNAKRI